MSKVNHCPKSLQCTHKTLVLSRKLSAVLFLSHLKTGYLSSIGFSLEELFEDYFH